MGLCALCGEPVPLENDVSVLHQVIADRAQSPVLVTRAIVEPSIHLLPTPTCPGYQRLAQYLPGWDPESGYTPDYEPRYTRGIRTAYNRMQVLVAGGTMHFNTLVTVPNVTPQAIVIRADQLGHVLNYLRCSPVPYEVWPSENPEQRLILGPRGCGQTFQFLVSFQPEFVTPKNITSRN